MLSNKTYCNYKAKQDVKAHSNKIFNSIYKKWDETCFITVPRIQLYMNHLCAKSLPDKINAPGYKYTQPSMLND